MEKTTVFLRVDFAEGCRLGPGKIALPGGFVVGLPRKENERYAALHKAFDNRVRRLVVQPEIDDGCRKTRRRNGAALNARQQVLRGCKEA